MDWIFFLILCIFAAFFFFLGYNYKTRIYVIFGSLFMVLLGFFVLTNGLSLPSGYDLSYNNFNVVEEQVTETTKISTINIEGVTLDPKFETIDSGDVWIHWLFGLLFILVFTFVLLDAFFNNRFNKFV